ncbi:MAG: ATP-dependent Clp protease ATP-binding subunit ClpC [Pyrinomonadaceae bacterium]|nr:ATP-dependent Clp protease ATP-binding subunit ClpC [Pyrinomonadaceae bacterium]
MTQFIIAGLVLLCLLSVGVVAYLSRALARLRRTLEEEMRSPRLLPREAQPEATLRDTAGTPETPPLISPEVTSETGATGDASGANATNEEVNVFDEPAPIATSFGLANTADATLAAANETPTVNELNIYSIAQALDTHYQQSGRPAELRQHEYFHKGVKLLEGYYYTTRDLIEFARESNVVVACMALEALSKRSDATGAVEMILAHINEFYYWPGYYALHALGSCSAERPVLASLLLHLKGAWGEYTALQSLREFVTSRTERGEREATFGDALHTLAPDQIELLTTIFDALKDVIPPRLSKEFESWKEARVDLEFLRSFGRVWKFDAAADYGAAADTDAPEGVLLLEEVRERVLEMETAVRKAPPRSVLLVGDSGVGKTALVRVLARRLQREHWIILEASAADVMAGQQYIGQLEGRVQTLVREIGGKRVLWVVPNFHELAWAGRHQYNPSGLLDLLLPHVESGAVKLIGEVPSAAYEKLMQMRPKLRTALETCRVNALGDEETLEVARRWAAGHHRAAEATEGFDHTTRAVAAPPRISEQTLQEAFQLAKQYLADKAAPGNLLLLLDSTHRRLLIERGSTDNSATNGATTNAVTNAAANNTATTAAAGEVTLDDLLVTLSQLTGLPVSILDDRAGLDLRDLRGFFEQRVLGQPEAVECLVERVAMIKAGLTDPTRPQGVFLFVGPTGTGKTEIAKTLAEFLFGSPERMIRLDMSEFQTPDALDRILGAQGDSAAAESTALVNSIRKQPFAVVLLDEFEKAHPQVWDLFLQVFDDGRLTDRRGNTADFRHCVVIMTSNLGATLPHGASIGFSQEQAQFAAGAVERAVVRAFRREFVNRIDRVVVFRPLGRSIMRDLLRKELNDVLRRRGLRTRQWAVEWDESAIDFLLEKGFTADLGARPLKRAIERYLLSPLALTIVNHQFPEGDQFLFVHARTGQSLDVEFVDPDAPDALPGQAARAQILDAPDEDAPDAGVRELRLESIVLDARGTLAEVQFLQDHFDALADQVDGEEWQGRKNSALLETSAPGFWNSPERFSVLGLAEYMDRIETGLDTAGSLLKRLNGSLKTRDRQHFPADLVARLAHQLYLIDAACRGLAAGHPRDLFLQVRASCDAGADNALCDDFARRISGMYRGWAEARRMRFEVLRETPDGTGTNGAAGATTTAVAAATAEPYQMLAAISGFAAYSLLHAEAGLHVLETPQEDDKSFNRARVHVRVVAQPDEPAGRGQDALRKQAAHAFASDPNGSQQIVRRYREEPSPLVRDSVRGWRTGKLERVLEGHFDLMF